MNVHLSVLGLLINRWNTVGDLCNHHMLKKQQPTQTAHLSGQSQIYKQFETFLHFITCLVGLGSPARKLLHQATPLVLAGTFKSSLEVMLWYRYGLNVSSKVSTMGLVPSMVMLRTI